jgi:hypothetical protein
MPKSYSLNIHKKFLTLLILICICSCSNPDTTALKRIEIDSLPRIKMKDSINRVKSKALIKELLLRDSFNSAIYNNFKYAFQLQESIDTNNRIVINLEDYSIDDIIKTGNDYTFILSNRFLLNILNFQMVNF